jgi:hypothetical protein
MRDTTALGSGAPLICEPKSAIAALPAVYPGSRSHGLPAHFAIIRVSWSRSLHGSADSTSPSAPFRCTRIVYVHIVSLSSTPAPTPDGGRPLLGSRPPSFGARPFPCERQHPSPTAHPASTTPRETGPLGAQHTIPRAALRAPSSAARTEHCPTD